MTGLRRVAVVLMAPLLVVATACSSPRASGGSAPPGTGTGAGATTIVAPPTDAPTTAPPTTEVVVARTRCQPAQLRLGVGPSVSEPTQQNSLLLTLTDVGADACFLFGYPGISLYGAGDVLLPLSSEWHGDQVVTASAPGRVAIAPGGAAYVMVNKDTCALGDASRAVTLRLIPPDATTALAVNIGGLRDLSSCAGDFPSTLDISPVEPTASLSESG